MSYTVGEGGHELLFSHPEIGTLSVRTGADRIAWGYALNTVTWPTYAGEVMQILSCYVDDLEIVGTLQTYQDVESLYTFFLQYAQVATQGDPRRGQTQGQTAYNEQPMTFEYPHRGWTMSIMPKSMPGLRWGREVVAPEWRIRAHVVDQDGDADALKDMIIKEAEIKLATGAKGDDFDDNFGLQGKIRFMDENPWSDPFTAQGLDFATNPTVAFQKIGDFYSKLLPSYLQGDFDALVGGMGSKPAFNADPTSKATSNSDKEERDFQNDAKTRLKKAKKKKTK
jgi:hypothetical protein